MEALATHMRIVVLQACRFDHALAAAKAAAARYPQARLVGFVREEDLPAARASGGFAEVRPLPSDAELYTAKDILGRPIDLCVLPFESRLGVYCWNFRLIPIRRKIPAVAIYNGLGQFREWSRLGWIVNSLVISVGLRSMHKSVLWVWGYLGRWLDIAAVFLLAGTALAVHGLRTLITPLFDLKTTMGLPAGRRRAVLFIPVLGVGGTQKQLVTFLQHL